MNLPGFLSDHEQTSFAIRPAATGRNPCAEQYEQCVDNCSSWPDPGVCECYCRNERCQCNNPRCPIRRCE